MKQNLLFNQASALGKRLAMVLTMLLTIGIGTMWGATFTTTSSGGFSNGTKTIDGITVTIAKGSGSSPSWQSGHVRVYQGNTISFSSTSSIVSITMKATSSSYVREFTASTGNFSTSSSTMSWEGSATSLTLTLPSGSQARITQIVVTVETGCTGTKLGTPVVTATPSDRQVILSWPNVSNASSYQLKWNGGEWVAATSPVTKTGLTNGTSYTYQVKAIGNGSTYCDGDASEEASATPNVYYTVTWNVNGEVYETTSVAGGNNPTFPATPSSCDATSNTFYGWATATWDGKIDDINGKTIYTSANDMPEVNGAVTYYAVFAKTSEDSSDDYKLVTSLSNLKSGVAYLGSQISYSGVRYYYMSSTAISSNLLSISNATVSSNILQTPNLEGKINLVSTGTANQYYIKNAEGKYLYSSAAGSLSWSTTACSWTFSNMNSTTGLAELTSSANSNIKLRAYGTSTTQGKLKTYSGTTNYGICVFLAEATTTYSDYITTCSTKTTVYLILKIGIFQKAIFGVSLGYLWGKTGYRHVPGGIVVVSWWYRYITDAQK